MSAAELVCLSGDTNRPCYLVRYNDTEIMLDCGLDTSQLLHFLPVFDKSDNVKLPDWKDVNSEKFATDEHPSIPCRIKESSGRYLLDSQPFIGTPEFECINVESLDVILISNYHTMMALPYLTRKPGFRAKVYATEPTIQTGRYLMEELVKSLTVNERKYEMNITLLDQSDLSESTPSDIKTAFRQSYKWSQLYSMEDIQHALSFVRPIAYNEKKDVYNIVKVMAISSGFCIGSCNWIIDSDHERISYLAGASTLTTHPRPMEHTSLRRSDVMIMSNLTRCPMNNPDSMIGDFCMAAVSTLKKGSNVLIPCLPCGVTFDMFECLCNHMKSCNMQSIPIYFISDKAEASLAYSNIYAEWLTSSKTANVYIPEPPFYHAELVRTGWLRVYSNLHGSIKDKDNFKTPAVIFCGHPTLRSGETTHFMNLYSKDPNCTLIFTDADINYVDALAPYQPVLMRVVYCPIDTRLSYAQANKLIRDLRPTHLVVPEQYTKPPAQHPGHTELVIDPQHSNLITHKDLHQFKLPLKSDYIQMKLNTKLAAELIPYEIKPRVAVAQITASLNTVDNKYELQPVTEEQLRGFKRKLTTPILYGNMNVSEFKRRLTESGISDVTVEDSGEGNCIIHMLNEDSLIQVEKGSIHIVCDDENIRVKIKDAALSTLQKIPAYKLN